MSKHIKEMQISVLRSRILNYSACSSLPSHRQVLQHETPFRSFTALHQRDIVLPGTTRKRARNALGTQRYEDLRQASFADTNCNISTRVRYRLASGFEDTRLTEEQPQQRAACHLGFGSNAAQKKSKHPRSGYGSFSPLITQGPQERDGLRIQTSLQHSASGEGANILIFCICKQRFLACFSQRAFIPGKVCNKVREKKKKMVRTIQIENRSLKFPQKKLNN